MKRLLWALVTASAISLSSAAVAGPRDIEVLHPWIPAPPGGAPTAAAYVVLKNRSARADAFLSASSPAAQTLQLHLMTTQGGVMRMRPVKDRVPIAAGQSLLLTPQGGYHFMFEHLTRPLRLGEHVPVRLTFVNAGVVKIDFVVETYGAQAGSP